MHFESFYGNQQIKFMEQSRILPASAFFRLWLLRIWRHLRKIDDRIVINWATSETNPLSGRSAPCQSTIWQDMQWFALPRHCKGHGQLPPCLGQSESLHDANGFKLWESITNQNPLWELAEPTLELAQFFHKYCWNQSHVLLDSMSCAMRVAFFCERWCVDKSKSCFAGCMLLKYVHSIATMSSENTVCKNKFQTDESTLLSMSSLNTQGGEDSPRIHKLMFDSLSWYVHLFPQCWFSCWGFSLWELFTQNGVRMELDICLVLQQFGCGCVIHVTQSQWVW